MEKQQVICKKEEDFNVLLFLGLVRGSLVHIMFKFRLQSNDTQNIFLFQVFRPPIFRCSLSLYSYLNCIPALQIYSHQIYSHWSFFGCLSHQGFVRSGRICYKLWGYSSRVILPLMRPAELVQYIECRGDGYFTWIFPFLFACMSFLGILSFDPSGLLKALWGMLTLWAPRAVSLFSFNFRALIYVLD